MNYGKTLLDLGLVGIIATSICITSIVLTLTPSATKLGNDEKVIKFLTEELTGLHHRFLADVNYQAMDFHQRESIMVEYAQLAFITVCNTHKVYNLDYIWEILCVNLVTLLKP